MEAIESELQVSFASIARMTQFPPSNKRGSMGRLFSFTNRGLRASNTMFVGRRVIRVGVA